MRKFGALAMVAVGAVVFGSANVSQAAGNATVNVSATVVAQCNFSTGGSVAFGNLPVVPTNTVGAVLQPQFACTTGVGYTITDDGGLLGSHTMDSGADQIAYTFAYTAAGVGDGAVHSMDITSTVLAASYTGALAGVYSDTVTLTIAP